MAKILGGKGSLFDQFLGELRNVEVQHDRMRFRRNLERIGELMAYEISKELKWKPGTLTTPLGEAELPLLEDQPVVATILRAGLPLHQGVLNYFDQADNCFISAYRMNHKEDGSFDIKIEYLSSPSVEDRTVILCDPMLATGGSMVLAYKALLKRGNPKHVHVVAAIASREGLEYCQRHLPKNCTIWIAGLDEELTAQAYIVPGLGDAGDLAFGAKE
ncbi:MAG: uracil phosphoribosyltransferase [Flavobacteriales bacterium]|nr:uracil phosphoribosyltransferase [Flavobacteriales bacterium]MCB9205220.1 uracil phosphoribosyltransferase [Flavobacteriales bacterium]